MTPSFGTAPFLRGEGHQALVLPPPSEGREPNSGPPLPLRGGAPSSGTAPSLRGEGHHALAPPPSPSDPVRTTIRTATNKRMIYVYYIHDKTKSSKLYKYTSFIFGTHGALDKLIFFSWLSNYSSSFSSSTTEAIWSFVMPSFVHRTIYMALCSHQLVTLLFALATYTGSHPLPTRN